MSPLHKLFARPTGRRECRTMRPMLEILERRDCPTVTAAFNPVTGVLTVVGDEGNNVIDLFQPQDRVVRVVGDGQTWVFTDVDAEFVDTGDGDDQVTWSKPKEIVVVGTKIHIDVGARNDTVMIDDGGPLEAEPNFISTMNYSLNLGTGADVLNLAAANTGALNLRVLSADGSDSVEVGHTLGFRHEHIRPESNVRMDLAGSGNLVDVVLEDIDHVDLSIVSAPVPTEPVTGGTINVYWHVIRTDSTFVGRNDGYLQMISLSGTAGVDTPTFASAAVTTGPADDNLSIQSLNVDAFQVNVDTGAGDDLVAWDFSHSHNDPAAPSVESHGRGVDARATIDLGSGNDAVSFVSAGADAIELSLQGGDGNDTAVIDGTSNTFLLGEALPWRMAIDLGGGNDDLTLTTTDLPDLEVDVVGGDGDDDVHAQNRTRTTALWGLRMHYHLGEGNDLAAIELGNGTLVGNSVLDISGGEGDDAIHVRAHDLTVAGQWLTRIDPGPEEARDTKPKEIVVVGSPDPDHPLPGVYVRGNDDPELLDMRMTPVPPDLAGAHGHLDYLKLVGDPATAGAAGIANGMEILGISWGGPTLSPAIVDLEMAGGNDTVMLDYLSAGESANLQVDADLGAGDDSYQANYSLANGTETVVDVEGGAGRDAVTYAAEFNARDQVLDFSALFEHTEGAEVVNLDMRNAPIAGDLSVRAAVTGESDASRVSTHLVPWQDVRNDDVLLVDVLSFEQVELHLATAPNPNRPEKLDLNGVSFDPAGSAGTSVRFADRDDGVRLEATNWSEVHLGYETLEPTIPTPDPGALVKVRMNTTTMNHLGPHTSVLLDDGDGGLQLQAANFNETRLTLEATNPLPILPDSPEKLDLNGVSFSPAAGSRGPGEFVVPSLVKLDVHPSVLQAELLIETGGPGSALVTGQLPAAAGSLERPTFISNLSVVDADALTAPLQTVTLSGGGSDPWLPALDVDTSLAGAAEYELENEAEFIPVVRFAVNAPDQQAALKVTPRGSAAGIIATPAVKLHSFASSTSKSLSLDLTTGDEDDVVDASARGWDQVTNKMYTGGGDDLISWDFAHSDNDPAAPSVASHDRGVDVWASINAGDGNDAISFVNADASSIELFLSAGLGDDDVTVHGQSSDPFVFVRDPRTTGMVVDLGEGANKLLVKTGDFAEATQDIRSGNGIDQIEIHDRVGPFFDFKATRLQQSIRTGGGNDVVIDDIQGREVVESAINTGSGNDVLMSGFGNDLVEGSLVMSLSLGAGSDEAVLDFLGFRRIAMVIYTGPAGDGHDQILGTIRLSPADKVRRIRRTADGRQDLLELFVSADYDVQLSSDENTFYVLIGTPPPKA